MRTAISLAIVCLIAAPLSAQWATNGTTTTTTNTVGVGTTTPTAKLQVAGTGGADVDLAVNGRIQTGDALSAGGVWVDGPKSLLFGAVNAQTLGLWASGWRLVARSDTGFVGINTSTPTDRLEVNGNVKLSGTFGATFANGRYPFMGHWAYTSDGSGYGPSFLHMRTGTGVYRPQMWLRTVLDNSTLHVSNALTLGAMDQNAQSYPTWQSTVHLTAVTGGNSFINNGGKVGIGTTTPAYTLDVAGTFRATQVIGSVYQDIAEWVPATENLAAGTVVVVSPEEINTVMPSSQEYQTSVAGVVSAMPGILLGEAATNKVQVATTGRVKVRVSAANGAIKAGDLLVSSGKPGMAMKSEPMEFRGRKMHQPGTLIGKALEPLTEGEGEILVLLSLQ
jgi:hypothetical protein